MKCLAMLKLTAYVPFVIGRPEKARMDLKAVIHRKHQFIATGAFVLSVIVSYTPVGRQVDRLAEAFVNHRE
jgi:hypothetical protein